MERQFIRAGFALFLLIVSLGMRSAGAVTIRLICGGSPYRSGTCCYVYPDAPPTIPNDYSSTTTIPKLNFVFRNVRSPCKKLCGQVPRGAPLGGEPEWTTKFRRGAPSVRRSTLRGDLKRL